MADNELNIEEAADGIASDLGFGTPEPEEAKEQPVEGDETPLEPVEGAEPKEPEVKTEPVVRAAPSSWAKETHELWGKLPPEAQAQIEHREKQILDGIQQYKAEATYGKQLRDIATPYKAHLQALGVTETQAFQYLLSADYKLRTGSEADRYSHFATVAKQYGLDLSKLAGTAEAEPVNPQVKALEEKLNGLVSNLTAREQAELNSARERTAKEVETFASDPAHPYFDEVANEIVVMIKGGYSLQDAYERAIYANPVTRAKELGRIQTEADTKRKAKLKEDAAAARKASEGNVRSRDTKRAPTEPLGTMDETMKSTLSEIRSRVH